MLQVRAGEAPLDCRVEVSPLAWCQGDTLTLEDSPPRLPWHLHPDSPSSWEKVPGATGIGILPLNKKGINLLHRLCPPPSFETSNEFAPNNGSGLPHIDWGTPGGQPVTPLPSQAVYCQHTGTGFLEEMSLSCSFLHALISPVPPLVNGVSVLSGGCTNY